MSHQTPSLRPLTLTDSQILQLVQQYDVVDEAADNFNVEVLFSVVSDIMTPSFGLPADSLLTTKTEEGCKAINFEPPVQTLKHIACQMMHTTYDEHHTHAHETTTSILNQLKPYSSVTKAVITLAAFSLEFGNFKHLSRIPSGDNLGRSLALLNHVDIEEGSFEKRNTTRRRSINSSSCDDDDSEYIVLVKNVFETVKSIMELKRMFKLMKLGFQEKDDNIVPTLKEAMRELPVFVYWVVLAIVVSALHIDLLMPDLERKYDLFNISSKVSTVLSKLKALLGMIRKEIDQRDDYLRSHEVQKTPTDHIVEVFLAGSEDISE